MDKMCVCVCVNVRVCYKIRFIFLSFLRGTVGQQSLVHSKSAGGFLIGYHMALNIPLY